MSSNLLAVQIERATEQLRQEREIFEQRKRQESQWFLLRLVMGYSSVVLLVTIMAVASYILYRNAQFPISVVRAAGAALFTDVLGTLIGVWKIALNPNMAATASPVTNIKLPDIPDEDTGTVEPHDNEQTKLASEFVRSSSNMVRKGTEYSGLTYSEGDADPSWVEWEFNSLPDEAYVHIRFTAAASRPCKLLINGDAKPYAVVTGNTGSWFADGLKWECYGPYRFRGTADCVRLERKGVTPHFERIVISEKNRL
jgi:hypothetical protein